MADRVSLLLRRSLLSAVLLAPSGVLPTIPQESFVVVVNTANPVASLTRQQVSDIFMKRMTEWPAGGSIHPVDLPAVSATRDAFSRAVHGRPGSAVASYWGQQVFSGRAVPPPQRPTDRAVMQYVRSDAAAIGYVSAGSVTGEVKTLTVN